MSMIDTMKRWFGLDTLPRSNNEVIVSFKKEKNDDLYAPTLRNRWVINIPGVDAFLPCSILLPSLREEGCKPVWSQMKIDFYNVVGINLSMMLSRHVVEQEKQHVKLSFLSATGLVVEKWEMELVAKEIFFSDLDYSNRMPIITSVSYAVENVKIT
jgi:hypothetical protein